MDLAQMMAVMLDLACGSLDPNPGVDGVSEVERYGGGYQEYRIETHCVAFAVSARKVDGVWEVKGYKTEGC